MADRQAVDAVVRHLMVRVELAKKELAMLRQAQWNQTPDITESQPTTLDVVGNDGHAKTPVDETSGSGAVVVVDGSTIKWLPESGLKSESPESTPQDESPDDDSAGSIIVDNQPTEPLDTHIPHNDERMQSVELEQLKQEKAELESLVHSLRHEVDKNRAALRDMKSLYDKEVHRSRLQALALKMLQDELHLHAM